MESSASSLVCLVITTMGRVLLQYERDSTLPFHYPQLALLLASLVQYATSRQKFVGLQLSNGYSVVLSVDSAACVACAVLFTDPTPATGEWARLTSLVVLREFLTVFHDDVEQLVIENRADTERMTEAYTLTSALDGIGETNRVDGDDNRTMDPFLDFQHHVVARLLETGTLASLGVDSNASSVDVLHAHVLNATTGVSFAVQDGCIRPEVTSDACQRLVQRAARALDRAFSVLKDTPATTLVLRLIRPNETTSSYEVAVHLFHHGVFAAIVYYHTHKSVFRGHDCELLRGGRLQRELMADPRGVALAQLIREAETSSSFALHIGSDGVPVDVQRAVGTILRPWTLQR